MAKKKKRKAKKSKPKKKIKAKKVKVKKAKGTGEKVLATVDHYFGNIQVAAFKLKAPLQVGDMIHVKGATTDFTQRIDSIQIEHESVARARKGAEIGIKVKDKVRVGDTVYMAASEKTATAKPMGFQQPIFPSISQPKPQVQKPAAPQRKSETKKPGGYGDVKFFKF